MISETIYSKAQIIKSMQESFDWVKKKVSETAEPVFYQAFGEKWSIAENMDHLIRSCRPVASALKMPKAALQAFGSPDQATRSYETIVAIYQAKLKEGTAVASGPFVPENSLDYPQADMLRDWQLIAGKFAERTDQWEEEDLDQYVIPHPVLGKLTVREMLFFTINHNYHHLRAMNRIA